MEATTAPVLERGELKADAELAKDLWLLEKAVATIAVRRHLVD